MHTLTHPAEAMSLDAWSRLHPAQEEQMHREMRLLQCDPAAMDEATFDRWCALVDAIEHGTWTMPPKPAHGQQEPAPRAASPAPAPTPGPGQAVWKGELVKVVKINERGFARIYVPSRRRETTVHEAFLAQAR